MKTVWKKGSSLVLTLCMLFGMLPMIVTAADPVPAAVSYQGDTYALLGENMYIDSYTIGTGYLFVVKSEDQYISLGVDAGSGALTAVPLAESSGILTAAETLAVFTPEPEEGERADIISACRAKVNGSGYLAFGEDYAPTLTDSFDEGAYVWASDVPKSGETYRRIAMHFYSAESGYLLRYLSYSAENGSEIRWKTEKDEYSHFYIYQKVCDHAAKTDHPANPATCTAVGNEAYSYCPTCGSYLDVAGERTYDNEGYTNVYQENSFRIMPLGHRYADGVCVNDEGHKARKYELVTSDDMIVPEDCYRYILVSADGKVFGVDQSTIYDETGIAGSRVEDGVLTLDGSDDPAGVYAAEFALSEYVPEDPGMSMPTDGTAYVAVTDTSKVLLAMGELRTFYDEAGDAKYPIGLTVSDGILTLRSWNYGEWGEPAVYDAESGFILGDTPNVYLYRGVLTEEEEEPNDTGLPEYLTVDGQRFRLNRGTAFYGNGEENDPLQNYVIVARSGSSFYSLNEAAGAVTASLLGLTDGELYGEAAIVNVTYGGVLLSDGRKLTLTVTDANTGAAAFGFGTQADADHHEWRDIGGSGCVHHFVHYYYDNDKGIPYGNQVWALCFNNGFYLSNRTTIDTLLSEGQYPADGDLLVYQRLCEHNDKTRFEGREPDCVNYGFKTYYVCSDCGLFLDEDLGIYTTRLNWEDREYTDYFEFSDFYTCPALGHAYNQETDLCDRCGEPVPKYEKVTDVDQLISGRRYLIIQNGTGLALDMVRPTLLSPGVYSVDLTGRPIESVETGDGYRTVYGSGGAAFYLQDAPDTEAQAREIEDEYTDNGYASRSYLVDVEGHFAFIPDYSWEFPNPLHFGDKILIRDVEAEIAEMESEEELEMYWEQLKMDWGLTFTFLTNGDVAVRYFDGMHPITVEDETEYKFTLREEWIYEEDYLTDEYGEYLTDPETGEYLYNILELPTNVSLWREAVEEPEPVHEHDWSTQWNFDGSHHWHECGAAGCDITNDADKEGYAVHTFGDWAENTDAGATEGHHRDCAVCGYREYASHRWDDGVTVDPTCVRSGVKTYTCVICGAVKTETLDPTGRHSGGEPVIENETPATCTEAGGYDRVIYCAVCNTEMSRTHETVLALGHDTVSHGAKPATCTEIGWEAYDTCSRCDYTTYVEIPAKGHVPGDPVREKETPATCTEDGHYDSVVYCTECQEELSRTTVDVTTNGHSLTLVPAREATAEAAGNTAYFVCSVCGKWFADEEGTVEITDHDSVLIHADTLYYPVTADGEPIVWEPGNGQFAQFTFKRTENDGQTFELFTGVQVDGVDLAASEYTAEPGSVIVKIRREYMDALSEGAHTVTARFRDGTAQIGFTVAPTADALPGDVDGDGRVTSTDARLVLQLSVGKIRAENLVIPAVADVDGDGKVTSTDARLILQYSVGKIEAFPAKQI